MVSSSAAAHGCHCAHKSGARQTSSGRGHCCACSGSQQLEDAGGWKGGNQSRPSCIQSTASCSGTLRTHRGAPPWYPREPGRSTRLRRPSASPANMDFNVAGRIAGRAFAGRGAAQAMALPGKTLQSHGGHGLPNCSHSRGRNLGEISANPTSTGVPASTMGWERMAPFAGGLLGTPCKR